MKFVMKRGTAPAPAVMGSTLMGVAPIKLTGDANGSQVTLSVYIHGLVRTHTNGDVFTITGSIVDNPLIACKGTYDARTQYLDLEYES